MQNQSSNGKTLKLNIITPDSAPYEILCDSVRLTVSDGEETSGLYGIHKGHTDAVLLLASGKCEAFIGPDTVKSFMCGEGFAKIENGDTVTVTVESAAAI